MDCISIQNISANYNYNPGKTVASPKFGRKTDAQVDTFVLNNKNSKPESKKRNWFGWALAGAVTLLGVASVLYVNCRKLSPEKLQKLYKELYMRDDISVEEAKNIWQRFKDLDKIKDKEEYIKAVFEETKKNFGMAERSIRLKRCKSLENLNGTELGACERYNSYITITDRCKRDEVISTMHHEFRHAKQHELVHKLIYNTDPIYKNNVKLEVFREDLIDLCIENQVKPTDKELAKLFNKYVQKIKSAKDINFDKVGMGKELSPIIPLIKYIEKKYPEEVEKSVAKLMGESTPVPEKYMDFAKKCRDNFYNYVKNTDNKVGYLRQFVEVDARKAEQKISDSLNLYFPEKFQK